MSTLTDLAKEFYTGELSDYHLYKELSKRTEEPSLKEALERIANMEKGHARFWREFLRRRGESLPKDTEPKGRGLLLLAGKIINPMLLVSLLELGEASAYTRYYKFLKEKEEELSEEERQRLKSIILDELSHESTFREKMEELGLSNIRDMVLGMNDGLVELLGVVAGLSAVYESEPLVVGASGVVVGIAGAISMGVGAFISVRSQRQVNEAVREREKILAEVGGKGPPSAVDREENEIRSALFTGFSYLLGVVFPVTPFFFAGSSYTALAYSLLLALLVLLFVGGFIALVSGISVKRKIGEMLLSAGFAAGASYLIGRLVESVFGLSGL